MNLSFFFFFFKSAHIRQILFPKIALIVGTTKENFLRILTFLEG